MTKFSERICLRLVFALCVTIKLSVAVYLIGAGPSPPIITVNPHYISDTLFTGGTAVHSLVVGNIGASDLVFTITEALLPSTLKDAGSVATLNESSRAVRPIDQPHEHYHYVESSQRPPVLYRDSTLVLPPVSVVPIIDGLFSEDEWSDAAYATATVIDDPQGEERGKVYVKNSLDYLYVLIDYHTATGGNDENITGDVWFDLDNNGTDDGGFFSHISAGVLNAEWDYPAIMEFSNSGSPNDSTPHWILEYKIPLSTLGVTPDDTLGVHFVLYDFNGTGGEWENLTTFFDYNFPTTWADIVLNKDVSWLSASPDSGTISPGDSLEIDVTFDAMCCVNDGDHFANLLISSNDPITPVDSVLCYLHVIAAPVIALSNDTLDFDVVFVDYADTLTLQVSNIGSDTLEISNITTDNSAYTVSITNFSLPPDENQTVIVIFAPTAVGPSPSNLTVHCNDPNNPTATVMLLGEGLEAPIMTVNPDYISDTLFTGESVNHNLTIGNIGGSDLLFEIRIASLPSVQEKKERIVTHRASKGNSCHGDNDRLLNRSNDKFDYKTQNRQEDIEIRHPGKAQINYLRRIGPLPDSHLPSGEENQNYALEFDGVNDYVSIPTLVPIINEPIKQFTFEGWINVAAATNDAQQFMEGHTATWEIHVELEVGTNRMFFYISDDSGNGNVVTTNPISLSKWHHIACTYNGSTQRIYLDGVLEDSLSWSNTFTITTGITLGKDFEANIQYLNGMLDEVRIWNLARNQAAIQADMYREIGSNEPGLVGYWRLNEGSGYTAFDQTSNHNDGSLYGGVTWIASTAPISPAWLSVSPDSGIVPAASAMDIDISFSAARMYGGDYYSNLFISSNDPATPEDTVLCYLHVMAAPDIDLSDDTLYFDSVYVNYSDTLELQVCNIGTDTLVVSDIITDNIDFSVDITSFYVLPYEEQTVLVTFTPSTPGLITGNLVVISNDPDEPADTVALIGIGVTGITEKEYAVPTVFVLSQNAPNPFQQQTAINYGCPQRCEVELAIFDVAGRLVVTLLKKQVQAGYHTVNWNATDATGRKVPSGVYLLRFTAQDHSATKKLLLSK